MYSRANFYPFGPEEIVIIGSSPARWEVISRVISWTSEAANRSKDVQLNIARNRHLYGNK